MSSERFDHLDLLMGTNPELRLSSFPADDQIEVLLDNMVKLSFIFGAKRDQVKVYYGGLFDHVRKARDSKTREDTLVHCGAVYRTIMRDQLDISRYGYIDKDATFSFISLGETAAATILQEFLDSRLLEDRTPDKLEPGQEVFENIGLKLANLATVHDFIHNLIKTGYRVYGERSLVEIQADIRGVVSSYAGALTSNGELFLFNEGIEAHLLNLRLVRSMMILSSEEPDLEDKAVALTEELAGTYDRLEAAFKNIPSLIGVVDDEKLQIVQSAKESEMAIIEEHGFCYSYDGHPGYEAAFIGEILDQLKPSNQN